MSSSRRNSNAKRFLGEQDPNTAYEKFKSTVPLGRLAEPMM